MWISDKDMSERFYFVIDSVCALFVKIMPACINDIVYECVFEFSKNLIACMYAFVAREWESQIRRKFCTYPKQLD